MPFSLIRDRWIPIRYSDGTVETIRPSDLPRVAAKERPDWQTVNPAEFAWGRPDLRVATYELLIGLLAVAFPPEGDNHWKRLLTAEPNELPDASTLQDAFEVFVPFFDLDGDGPRFLQDFEALEGERLTPDPLFMDAPGANTLRNGGDLFIKEGRTPVLSRPAAAIALFALQAFAPSGGAGHRTSMRGGGPLSTLVKPSNATLWQRVWANVPRRPPLPADLARVFPWLTRTYTSEKGEPLPETEDADASLPWGHPLQAYFGMPRRIRLIFDSGEGRVCALTGGVDERVVTGFVMKSHGVNYGVWRHPLTPYYAPKEGAQLLPFHPKSSRFGYRQWVGVVYGDVQRQAAECVADYADRVGPLPSNVAVAGYVTDNMKVLDFLEADVPLILAVDAERQGELQVRAQKLVEAANFAAAGLRSALRNALDVGVGTTLLEGPVKSFWAETEAPFREALRRFADAAGHDDAVFDAGSDAANVAWGALLRTAALAAFDRAVPPVSLIGRRPAEQQKIIKARNGLRSTLFGYGASGKALFNELGLQPPEQGRRGGRKAA